MDRSAHVMLGEKMEMDDRTVDQMTDVEFVDWISDTVRFLNGEPPIYPSIRTLMKIELERYLPRIIELARKGTAHNAPQAVRRRIYYMVAMAQRELDKKKTD